MSRRGPTVERVLMALGLVAVTALVVVAALRRPAAPADDGAAPERGRLALADAEPAVDHDEADVILARNLFEAPPEAATLAVEESDSGAAPGGVPDVQAFYPGAMPYLPPAVPPVYPGYGVTIPQMPAVADARPAEGQPEAKPKEPEGPPVRVTATVRGPRGLKALVEDTRSGQAKWVSEGEEAFGVRLAGATSDGGLLEQGGRAFTMKVGEGKPEPAPPPPRPAASPAEPAQGAGQAGGAAAGAAATPPASGAPVGAGTPRPAEENR
jgi:hypothetical protein